MISDNDYEEIKNLVYRSKEDVSEYVCNKLKVGKGYIPFPGRSKELYRNRYAAVLEEDSLSKVTARKASDIADWGRLHAPGESIYYSSNRKLVSIVETKEKIEDIKEGDITHMLIGELKDYPKIEGFAGFGFHENSQFKDTKGKILNWRELFFEKLSTYLNDQQLAEAYRINRWCNTIMSDSAPRVNAFKDDRYKFTRAIAKKFLDSPIINCFVYPTVKNLKAGATNFAFVGGEEDKYLNFTKVEKIKIIKAPQLDGIRTNDDLEKEERRCLEVIETAKVVGDKLEWPSSS